MSKVVLKTAKRNTTVTRVAVRSAVTGVFISKSSSPNSVKTAFRKIPSAAKK